ncbi:hypothetical protein VE01_05110 [Pseudogymnoascus verrucosus]|uniref:DUF726 domain protein n=1 Tax=Pseudogymnoascus verrucosus TaxID=342668 RepID=A0A1B8GPL8_9PEZI|nr:uncharacterized protein VE01_05110 [Pseudogymnoascus verrucosus]OBT97762.1 hypothetical protein VE01_05110 [Pseudogymnoascus verrucosus]
MPGRDGGAASIRKGVEVDEWGLPVRHREVEAPTQGSEVKKSVEEEGQDDTKSSTHKTTSDKEVPEEKIKDTEDSNIHIKAGDKEIPKETAEATTKGKKVVTEDSSSDDDEFKDAPSEQIPETAEATGAPAVPKSGGKSEAPAMPKETSPETAKGEDTKTEGPATKSPTTEASTAEASATAASTKAEQVAAEPAGKQGHARAKSSVNSISKAGHKRDKSSVNRVSEWSHQQSAAQPEDKDTKEESEDEWQAMPAYAPFDIYDDDNKLVAKEAQDSDVEDATYAGLGGAGKGYTRVQLDEDAQSATSMDEHTSYLFKESNGGTTAAGFEDEEQRDVVSQMETTKDLLTEGQRIAYVGMTRLVLTSMVKAHEVIEGTSKGAKKETSVGTAAMRMFSQKMMIRLYAHMEISTPEQIMIEQLSEHGVEPRDLTPTLMANARVKNPMAEKAESVGEKTDSPRSGSVAGEKSSEKAGEKSSGDSLSSSQMEEEEAAAPPPPYVETDGEHLPEVRTPGQLPTTKNLDIDLRWTVLCDLFLTLVADSVYDARSRVLLEQVGSHLDVTWLDICRFEKRVTDALEMQQAAEKENWNEDEHKESRRKMALKKRYMMMGLATVGGGLVIGLSAGLLAPVIGAGLAAGFTTIGVAGTSGFLAGAGGAAIITSAAATSGGIIAVKAANRRTGAVKTFEYRPLHNNKRVNLIVTVSGWMTGKVDDVRLPYSTVDPIMGDIYSVLWEPEMLTSMGDTINILATEALTQGLQQVLGSTILIGLMAALQLPVVLTKLSYLIDNPWAVSLVRAESAGLILADSLIDRNLGTRPITFVGYSLGCRVIFSCLRELARKGAHGLVQNVYLFGSPIVAKKDDYLKARSVVAGRFVNGFARNDWILGYLFRLTSGGISRIAGLAPVDGIPGLENVDVTELVKGHMAYRTAMPRLLREVGWQVDSDEFSEIEDPDPENHQQRQRELINEIEEARKEFDRQEREAKGKFGFLKRKKKAAATKKEWETYQESREEDDAELSTKHDSVLFDIDAIRAELASENFEVKELESTLPPMKLDFSSPAASLSPAVPSSSLGALRDTKSADVIPTMGMYEESPSPAPKKSYTYGPDDGYKSYQSSPYLAPDDEVQMSFDTSYASPARSATGLGLSQSGLKVDEGGWGESRSYEVSPRVSKELRDKPLPPDPKDGIEVDMHRPPMRGNKTEPLGGNAWADEDDEDEFKEKEMEMTFA